MITVNHSHLVAIRTKYFGPSNVKGSRIKATANGNSATISYPHDCTSDEAHARAAVALCEKLGWNGQLIGGGLGDGESAFVFVEFGRTAK